MKGLTVTALLFCALTLSAVRLPGSVCAVSSAPIGKACHLGCCANKSCCADSQKNHNLPSPPLTKDGGANHELIAVAAASLTTFIVPVRSFELLLHPPVVYIASNAPRPARLCTFLI